MSGPQFFHLQTFSTKTNPAGQNADQVIGEARRRPEYSRHVPYSHPPIHLYGKPLEDLHADHETMIWNASTTVKLKDGSTALRSIRHDRHTLGTFVASYPVPLETINADASGQERALYENWKRLNLDFLQRRFGKQLRTVVEHTDEPFGHIHAFMLPDHRKDVNARSFNPAYAVKQRVEAEHKKAGHAPIDALKAANEAYKAAARVMADEYYREVGAPAGLTRDGPQRRRLSRGQWQHERLEARNGSLVIRQENEKAARTAQEARQAAETDLEAVRALTARLGPLQGAVAALDAWEAEKAQLSADRELAAWWAMTPQDRVKVMVERRTNAYRERAPQEEIDRIKAELEQIRAEAGTIIRVTQIDHETGDIAGQDLRTGEEVHARIVLTEEERIEHYPDPDPSKNYRQAQVLAARQVLGSIQKILSQVVVGSVVHLGALRVLSRGLGRIAAFAQLCDPPRRDPRTIPKPMPEAAKPAAALPQPLRQAIRDAGLSSGP